MIKKIEIRDNKLEIEKPIKDTGTKEIEFVMSSDNLVTIKQTLRQNRIISPISATTDHRTAVKVPSHITEVEGKGTPSGVPYYYVRPTFNYLALDWEAKLGALDELQSPMLYTQEEGKIQDKTFNINIVNRQFAKNIDRLDRFFQRRNRVEVQKHKNILFGLDFEYKKMNYFAKNYPFYIEIALANKTRNEFKKRLKDLGLYELLIEDYIQETKSFEAFGGNTLQVFNFNDWVNKSDFKIDQDSLKILSTSYTRPNNFFYNLKKLNFIGFTRKTIKAYQRRLFGILNGKESFSEIMFYRIDKYDNKTNRLVQTFWVPAEEEIKFVDTQVKYGVQYRYSCKASVLVMGTNYSITKENEYLKSTIEPSMKIIEIPMFEETCNIIQPPQPVPDIDFKNNKRNRRDLNILMKLNANYYNKEFIPLEQSEDSQNSLISEYNKLNRRSYFHYETEHALFEVFRMENLPKSYLEIDKYKIAEIKHPQPSTAVVLKDKISIGKKYYYMFRSINAHGLLSNPTPIYEIEKLEDADETFMNIKIVEIPTKNPYQPSRVMTRDIQVLPSSLHTIFDQSQEGAKGDTLRNKIDKLNLGIAEESIWGKRFKFRFTSKDTGKKIDINVNVELTKNKTEEDFK